MTPEQKAASTAEALANFTVRRVMLALEAVVHEVDRGHEVARLLDPDIADRVRALLAPVERAAHGAQHTMRRVANEVRAEASERTIEALTGRKA